MPRSVTRRDATGSFASVAVLTYAICASEGVWMCTSSRSAASASESESEPESELVGAVSREPSYSSGPPSAPRNARRFASRVRASRMSVASRASSSSFGFPASVSRGARAAARSALASAAAFTSSKRSPNRKRAASASFSSSPYRAMNRASRRGLKRIWFVGGGSLFRGIDPNSTRSRRMETSAVNTTVSFTKNPASSSNRVVNVKNSRQPQSLAPRPYRFCDSRETLFLTSSWLHTLSRCDTKTSSGASGSVTSRNIDRWFGGWLCPRGYTMRRHRRPPTTNLRLFTLSPDILRFFRMSLSLVKLSRRHTNRPTTSSAWPANGWPFPEMPSRARATYGEGSSAPRFFSFRRLDASAARDASGTPPPAARTEPSGDRTTVAGPEHRSARRWCVRASHASRTAWNDTENTARPSGPSKNPVDSDGAFVVADPEASDPEAVAAFSVVEAASAPPANVAMGMKSFQPRLVVSPPSASPAKRPYESRCTLFLPSLWCTADTRNTSQHDRLAATPAAEDTSPATFETRPAPTAPAPAPSAAVRAESAPALSPLIVSISLLSRHSDRHSTSSPRAGVSPRASASSLLFFSRPASFRATELWYAESRNAQSPTANDGDITFCVLIIAAKCDKFSTVHVNRPVNGGSFRGTPFVVVSVDPSPLAPLFSPSTTSSEDSSRKMIRASTVSASSTRYPFRASSTTALRAKSHHPCDFLRALNLCQLSRRAPASAGSPAAADPADASSLDGRTTASS